MDTISVTIPINSSRIVSIDRNISSAFETFFGNVIIGNPSKSGYRNRIRLGTSQQRYADIFIDPYYSKNNYLRIEYSANNLGESGRILLTNWLEFTLGESWRREFFDGNLTRIDLAVELPRLTMNDLIVIDNRAGKKSFHLFGSTRSLETSYYPPFSNKQLIVYDKLRERFDKGKIRRQFNRVYAEKTRFEYRQQNLRGYTLNNFYSRQIGRNPFKKFTIKNFAIVESLLDEEQQRAYFHQLRLMGLPNVLMGLQNRQLKEQVNTYYSKLPTPNIFKYSPLIWNGLRHALDNVLPL